MVGMTELFTEVPPDRRGMVAGLWMRRAALTVFALIALAALAGFIGQRARTFNAATPAARMHLQAPEIVRGGLFFQARLDIRALAPIGHPRIVLGEAWLEGMQVNSIEPAPDSESSRDGRLVLSYGRLKRDDVLRIWMQFEVNPTNTGARDATIALYDAERLVARISHTL